MSKMNSTEQAAQNVADQQVNCLEVTHAQVFVLKETVGKTLAFARIVLNEQIQLTGIRVINGSEGPFISYPNDPSYKGEDYRSIFYPLTKELRQHVEKVLLEKYAEASK